MKKPKKKILRIGFILLLFFFTFLHFYAPRFITEIKNPIIQLIKGNSKNVISLSEYKIDTIKRKKIEFKSFDNTTLIAFLTYSNLDIDKGTIILLHGIRSNKESFLELSNKLSSIGYNSIALDSRAHGESQGTHCTFGVKEKKDISELINILKTENISSNIGVWGQSLGGAIGLQALGYDKRINFGIIESTFSDFKTITNDYFNYHLGFNINFLTDYLIYRSGKIAEFNPNDAKPIEYCKKINQPILIIHGNKDKRINIKYAKANFANISSSDKTFMEIENANHLNVWKIGNDEYFKRVFDFINKKTIGNNN